MNIFSYESKFTQTLMFVADLGILNLCFLLCCLPIFTIGAAQAGLYSGIRTLQDPEDDGSPVKAFFKGFRTGFKQITLAWGLLFLALAAMLVVLYFVVGYGQTTGGAPVWMTLVALAIFLLFQSLVPLFHARFTCTAKQLLRNAWFLVIAHPLRSILVTVLTWLPVVIGLLDLFIFLMCGPAWLLLYYAVAFLLNFNIMRKPFQVLIDHYNETHGITPPAEESEEVEEAE